MPDLTRAIDLVIGSLDGHPLLPRIAAVRPVDVIGGLVGLALILGERIAGPDGQDAYRASLLDLQAHERLRVLFADQPEETTS
ncbi:hypothetical protein ACFP2T_15355 [Plantactinospora solaniradicis]|uniref:Uncharacterized protein n=1 Tax=Plantactinospora solaniradicis TaxID=1723736 RepID=A0ABW1K7J6_9ACTN